MSAFDRISARIPNESRNHVSKTLDIVERIQAILEDKGMSQKDLATVLGKSPSEISRWMSGLHNFELKTLVKIEEALGEEVFTVANPSHEAKFSSQGSISLATKIASLPEELVFQAMDFVDYLGHRASGGQLVPKPSGAYQINAAPAAAAQEPTSGKYQKKK